MRVARSSGVSPPQLVVAQDRFYDHLYDDLADAREQVVIYSPFATADRVGQLEPHLRAAIERGVGVWVITKTLEERSSPFSSGSSEASHASCSSTVRAATPLCRWGEAVLIDSQVLWQGLLNPLSFSATHVVVEASGSGEHLDTLLASLSPYGIEELARTSAIAMRRSTVAAGSRAAANEANNENPETPGGKP